VILKLYMSVSH